MANQDNSGKITRGSFLSLFGAAGLTAAAAAARPVDPPAGRGVTFNFHFCGDSYHTNTDQQTGGPYTDRLVMAGSGQIQGNFELGQTVRGGRVNAQGSFAHYQLTDNLLTTGNPLPPGNNIPLKFTGTWKATNLVSFNWIGLMGTDAEGDFPLAAGVLILDIVLVRPSTPTIPLTRVPSWLWLVSTLGTGTGTELFEPGGFAPIPDMPDGITLLAPADFNNGFYFRPIPVQSTLLNNPGEPHTSVMFGTLNENRNEPPPAPPST